MKTKSLHRRAGFTLLEILIVIGILAMLAAFVVPRLIGSANQANIGVAQATIGRSGVLAGALGKYQLDLGAYPPTEDGMAALFRRPSSISEDGGRWKGPYLEARPEELRDPWGEEFVYVCPGKFNEDGYDLYSKGPDRRDSTDDDIRNWPSK
jgi:general secretion pathway protein G